MIVALLSSVFNFLKNWRPIAIFAMSIAGKALSFILAILLGNNLNTEEFGEFNQVMATLMAALPFYIAGLDRYIIRDMHRFKGSAFNEFLSVIAGNFVVNALVLSTGIAVFQFFWIGSGGFAPLTVMFLCGIRALTIVFGSLFVAAGWPILSRVVSEVLFPAGGILIFLCVYKTRNTHLEPALLMLYSGVLSLIICFVLGIKYKFKLSTLTPSLGTYLSCISISVALIPMSIFPAILPILIGTFDFEAPELVSPIRTQISLVLIGNMVVTSIGFYQIRKYNKLIASSNNYELILCVLKSVGASILIGFPICIVYYLWAENILELFRPGYSGYASGLRVLVIGMFIGLVFGNLSTPLMLIRGHRFIGYSWLFASVLLIILYFIQDLHQIIYLSAAYTISSAVGYILISAVFFYVILKKRIP